MDIRIAATVVLLTISASAQDAKPGSVAELRSSVREWVDVMSKVQLEENDWKRDKEVLENYQEGLGREIADLRERIAEAELRREGADKESLESVAERDRYLAARGALATGVRRLEELLAESLGVLPAPLRAEPKMAEALESLAGHLRLSGGDDAQLGKRLMTLVTITAEAEKFQQGVHLRQELHKDGNGREFNMQVIYFGLAMAYAVNDDMTFALCGRPGADGWVFRETPGDAAAIAELIGAATGDRPAGFVNLPFSQP